MKNEIVYTENMIKTIISSIGFKGLMIALHNSLNHGIILEETGCDVTSEQLINIFEHVDALVKIAKDIE